jgi:hypothetical protein
MKNLIAVLLAVLMFAPPAIAGRSETFYQRKHCRGALEARMPNGTRADCLTGTHAIEFDFARKWLEAIGQSLNYAEQTGLRAGITLICEKPKDKRKMEMLLNLIDRYNLPIDVWGINCR